MQKSLRGLLLTIVLVTVFFLGMAFMYRKGQNAMSATQESVQQGNTGDIKSQGEVIIWETLSRAILSASK